MEEKENFLALHTGRFLTAVRFLTRLPVGWGALRDGENFQASLLFFPLVGLLIGLGGFFCCNLLLSFLPVPVVAILMIIYLAAVSGCLHLDGLADTADGLLSSRPVKESLAIMRDSRVGAMGVICVVFLVALKFAALISLSPAQMPLALFFMPLAGRVSIVIAMALLPYARGREQGLGALFYGGPSKAASLLGTALFILFALLLCREDLVSLVLVFLTAIFLFLVVCKKALGGATGDTLGAGCEISETAIALAFTLSFTV